MNDWNEPQMVQNFSDKLEYHPEQLNWYQGQPGVSQVHMAAEWRGGNKNAIEVVANNGGPRAEGSWSDDQA